jgi:hypothetical protein
VSTVDESFDRRFELLQESRLRRNQDVHFELRQRDLGLQAERKERDDRTSRELLESKVYSKLSIRLVESKVSMM